MECIEIPKLNGEKVVELGLRLRPSCSGFLSPWCPRLTRASFSTLVQA